MERKMVDAKLQGMKRAELQRLAKKAGIKANMKTDAIIEALQKYYSDSGELPTCSNSSRSDDSSGAQTTSDSAASSANEESVEKSSMSPKRVVRRGRKGRKTRVKDEAKPNDDVITPDKAVQQKPTTSTTKSTDKQKTEVASTKSTPKIDSTAPSDTVTYEVPNRRKTHSVTPKTGNKIIPIVTKAPVLRRTTRSVTPKGDISKPAKEEAKNSRRNVRKKRSVSSDPEMKKRIMADLEKTAEEKVSLQSKIPKPKTAVAKATKPITPGNKDWNRIHQAQFDKMESIGDYMARKRKRTESICVSAKKVKLIADESQSAVLSRTPQGGHAKIAKPVFRVRANATSFSSPKFTSRTPKPSMTQARIAKTTGIKTVTFKTSRLKTPTRATLLLGGVSEGGGLIQRRKSTPGPRKSISVIGTPGKKPVFDLTSNRKSIGDQRKSLGASTTPFKFGQTSPGAEAYKSAFDLKASLCKPLGYKPYTGKLKPLDTMSTFPSASNIQRAKVNIKKKHALKTRDTRRAGARQTRANKRANDIMARRGIKAM